MLIKYSLVAAASVLAFSAQAQTVVKIGHVGPISGAIAHLGKDNENGARLAIEDLNAKGISIGGAKVKFAEYPRRCKFWTPESMCLNSGGQ